jgi:hypothetical protein
VEKSLLGGVDVVGDELQAINVNIGPSKIASY